MSSDAGESVSQCYVPKKRGARGNNKPSSSSSKLTGGNLNLVCRLVFSLRKEYYWFIFLRTVYVIMYTKYGKGHIETCHGDIITVI